VNGVFFDADAEFLPNRARFSIGRIGSSHQFTPCHNGIFLLKHQHNHRASRHKGTEVVEERTFLVDIVKTLSLSFGQVQFFHPDDSEPGTLNPIVIDAMREAGIDISGKKTRSTFDLYKSGQLFHYVITVCDEAGAERCPIFPGHAKRLHWSFPDPSALEGTYEEKLQQTRIIRDSIKAKIKEWLKEMKE